jgi:hypothetical protein
LRLDVTKPYEEVNAGIGAGDLHAVTKIRMERIE